MTQRGDLLARGRTSDVYWWGTDAVVKVPRPHVPTHWAAAEAAFTTAARDLGNPVPAVVGMTEVDGRPSVIFDHVAGPSLWDCILETPSSVDEFARVMADVHRAIHRSGIPAGVWAQTDRMRNKIDSADQLDAGERDASRDLLGRMPSGGAMLHGDLHPANILMGADGPVVIDWFDASIGHPVADIVRSALLIRPISTRSRAIHLRNVEPDTLAALREGYLREMAAALAPCRDDLGNWEALMAVGRLAEVAADNEEELIGIRMNRAHSTLPELFDRAVANVREMPGRPVT